MPLPHPNKKENQQEFVSRCMGNTVMLKDFPDQKQRAAVCYSQFKKHKKVKAEEMPEDEASCQACQEENLTIKEALSSLGIWYLDMSISKVTTQCDNCKTAIDTSKPKKPKAGEGAKPNPAIQAELETGVDTGETKTYHFCDEECLRQYLNKRIKK